MSNDQLAKYAIIESNSKGRQHLEDYDDATYRSTFGRDRDRIISSSAFRRLQYKTQVFVNYHGDHYRTRLTHSLEVAQAARWIAGGLQVNKDLAEIVAIAHDLGHPPFGHAGEEALNSEMQKYALKNRDVDFGQNFGFSHNAHTLKLATKIETRFIEFEGLNLCWETLEGIAKHNGPIDVNNKKTDQYIIDFNRKYDLDLSRFSSLEAQLAAIADDITYNNHDIEDGLRADLFHVEQLFDLPLIGKIYQEILAKYPKISRELLAGEARKRLFLAMIIDVIDNTKNNIAREKISTQEGIRNFTKSIVGFSDEMEFAHQKIKKFLMQNMYRHPQINNMTMRANKIIENLFAFYIENPKLLPQKHHEEVQNSSKKELAIIIANYIAGMTDRFAINEHNKLFGYQNNQN